MEFFKNWHTPYHIYSNSIKHLPPISALYDKPLPRTTSDQQALNKQGTAQLGHIASLWTGRGGGKDIHKDNTGALFTG